MARTSLGVVAAGTLLSLAVEEEGDSRDQQRGSPLGVDPYLAVPNIVLLYNEHRLKNARLREAALSANQRGPIRQRVAIGDTEDGLSEMAGTLAQHLPNVFHYPSERQLRKQGRESRGLDDLETYIRLRIDDLSSVLESRVRRRDRWTAVRGDRRRRRHGVSRATGDRGQADLAHFAGAVALFVVFLRLRDKLF